MQERDKHQWAAAHWRGVVLALASGEVVVREASLWEEHGLVEDDVRPLLSRMEADGEIERFAGFYRVRHADLPPSL